MDNREKVNVEPTKELRVVNKLLRVIYNICDLAGYRVENRIILKNKITGKEWV